MKVIFSLLFPSLIVLLSACEPNAEALLRRGKSLLEAEKYIQAIHCIDSVIEARPEWELAFQMRAIAHFESHNYEKAVTDFGHAIRLDSASYQNYYYRANAFQEMEKYQPALADYHTVIGMRPEFKEAYIQRAVVLFRQEEYQKALEDLHKAYQFDQTDTLVLLNRAKIYVTLKSWEDALQDLQKLQALKAGGAEANYLLGIVYQQSQQAGESCEAWQKAAEQGSEKARQAVRDFCENAQSASS